MADVTFTAASVRPLNSAIIRRGVAGASLTAGQVVYLDGASGWKPADANALANVQARGIVAAGSGGATTFATGTTVDIVTYGPVTGFAGMTPGAAGYVSTTAGAIDQTAPAATGKYPFVAGWAESANVFFVAPQTTIPTANS